MSKENIESLILNILREKKVSMTPDVLFKKVFEDAEETTADEFVLSLDKLLVEGKITQTPIGRDFIVGVV